MLVNEILYSFSIVNSKFTALLSEKSNKKLVEKIKEYNFELEIVPPCEYNNEMRVADIFSKEIIYLKCNEGGANKISEYKSENLYFSEKKVVFNKKIQNKSLELNNCTLVFSFENNEQKIDFINSEMTYPMSGKDRTEQVLKERKAFLLLKEYLNKHQIDLFKIISGDSNYLKSLNETFDFILLETENRLLPNICDSIFNSFNIKNYKIEKKRKNLSNFILFKKRKMQLEYNRMPSESKQLMLVLTLSMVVMFLSVMINFLGLFT